MARAVSQSAPSLSTETSSEAREDPHVHEQKVKEEKATLNVRDSAQNMVATRLETTAGMADINSVLWDIGGNENGDILPVGVPQSHFSRKKKISHGKRPGYPNSEPVCDDHNPSTKKFPCYNLCDEEHFYRFFYVLSVRSPNSWVIDDGPPIIKEIASILNASVMQ